MYEEEPDFFDEMSDEESVFSDEDLTDSEDISEGNNYLLFVSADDAHIYSMTQKQIDRIRQCMESVTACDVVNIGFYSTQRDEALWSDLHEFALRGFDLYDTLEDVQTYLKKENGGNFEDVSNGYQPNIIKFFINTGTITPHGMVKIMSNLFKLLMRIFDILGIDLDFINTYNCAKFGDNFTNIMYGLGYNSIFAINNQTVSEASLNKISILNDLYGIALDMGVKFQTTERNDQRSELLKLMDFDKKKCSKQLYLALLRSGFKSSVIKKLRFTTAKSLGIIIITIPEDTNVCLDSGNLALIPSEFKNNSISRVKLQVEGCLYIREIHGLFNLSCLDMSFKHNEIDIRTRVTRKIENRLAEFDIEKLKIQQPNEK